MGIKKYKIMKSKSINSLEELFWLYPNKPWNWEQLSNNKYVTCDMIQDNLDKPWNWITISHNPTLTWQLVEANPIIPWNWSVLSCNENIAWHYVKDHPMVSWKFVHFSQYVNEIYWGCRQPNVYHWGIYPDFKNIHTVTQFQDMPWNHICPIIISRRRSKLPSSQRFLTGWYQYFRDYSNTLLYPPREIYWDDILDLSWHDWTFEHIGSHRNVKAELQELGLNL